MTTKYDRYQFRSSEKIQKYKFNVQFSKFVIYSYNVKHKTQLPPAESQQLQAKTKILQLKVALRSKALS